MEKGKAKQLLDRMQAEVEHGQGVPLTTGKVLVDKEEFLEMIKELKKTIDIELKAYHEITDKRNKIIKEAKKEAEDIIVEAEESSSRIRLGKPNPLVVQRKVKNLDKQDKMALRTANEIYAASIIYTDEMLMEVNETVRNAYNMISFETDRVLDSLRIKSEIIEKNKKELMDGLMDMKKQERYADILEISQLLANEIYYEKNKTAEEETDGSEEQSSMVQLEFDFEDDEKNKIKVRPSRESAKQKEPNSEEEIVNSAFDVIDELGIGDKKNNISEDRTPVPLDEQITDATVRNVINDTPKRRKPEIRISGGPIDKDL